MTAVPNPETFTLPREWQVLLDMGLSVIPVPRNRKVSALAWKAFQTARADAATVRRWAAQESNIAVVTGALSGLVALDLDNAEAVAEAEAKGLPDTVTVRTPRGLHVWFKHPGGVVPNVTALRSGWDIRGDGGYVMAPSSYFVPDADDLADGKVEGGYSFENPPGLFDVAPMPEWLLTMLRQYKAPKNRERDNVRQIRQTGAWAEAALRNELIKLSNAPSGERNKALNKAAFSLAQIVAGEHLDETEVRRRLFTTAAAIGLKNDETGPTIESGFTAGMKEPRHPPEQSHSPRQQEGVDPETGEILDAGGVTLSDFRAYMPAHNYIFAPSGEPWPAASVNSRIAPIALLNANGEPVLDDKGKPKHLTAAAWLDQNKPVEQLTWAPGEPQVVNGRLISDGGWIARPGCAVFNLYRPPIPLAGDADKAGPWIEHLRRVYPEDAEHLIHWLAHRVQRPADKINHAIVMGGSQGIGKDTILEPVKAAIGPWNFNEVSPQNLLGRFNGFVKSVIMRVSEARDLGDVDRFAFYDHMKTYTAAPPDVLRVDEKHVREDAVFNVCGVIITTNHKSDGIYLPADDRRHYVAWSDCTRDTFAPDYWNKLYGWYRDGGTGHVAAYLRALPLDRFDAKAPPPKTAAFWDIVASNQAPEDAELADALEKLGRPSVTTVASIAALADSSFAEWLDDRRNARRIPHRLEQCGYRAVRCPSTSDGRWKVAGRNVVIYARRELATREAIAAAERYAMEVRQW